MKVKDIIKKLQKYKDQNYQMVYDMFCEDDIRECAKNSQLGTLTDREVTEVIKYLESHADAVEGLNWEAIWFAIEQITNKGNTNERT